MGALAFEMVERIATNFILVITLTQAVQSVATLFNVADVGYVLLVSRPLEMEDK
jgi:hypothetical protein